MNCSEDNCYSIPNMPRTTTILKHIYYKNVIILIKLSELFTTLYNNNIYTYRADVHIYKK